MNIPSLIDQEVRERDAMLVMNSLPLLSPSPECIEAITPFFCLFIFTLCDSSNNLHIVLREDCLELRDNVCAEEWNFAALLGPGVLPVCEDLPDRTDECAGKYEVLHY